MNKIVNGKTIKLSAEEEQKVKAEWNKNIPIDKPEYIEKRRALYKPIPEQLDMQYWDMVNGTDLWKQHIESVKSLCPKEV